MQTIFNPNIEKNLIKPLRKLAPMFEVILIEPFLKATKENKSLTTSRAFPLKKLPNLLQAYG